MDRYQRFTMPTSSKHSQEDPATQYPWSPTPQSDTRVAPSIGPQTPLNMRPNNVRFEPISTPLPPFSQFSQISEFPASQPLVRQPRGSRLNALNEKEQTLVVQWCIARQNDYRNKNVRQVDFWANCTAFIRDKFNKTNMTPVRSIKTWVKKRRLQVAEERRVSGRAISDTKWKQALDKWIQVLDDIEIQAERDKASKKAAIDQHKAASNRSRDTLTTRLAKRSADSNDLYENSESDINRDYELDEDMKDFEATQRSLSVLTGVFQSSHSRRLSSTPTPSQASSSTARKRQRREDPYIGQLERLIGSISGMRKDFQEGGIYGNRASGREESQDLRDDIRELKQDLSSLKSDMNTIMSLLKNKMKESE
ncbi:hypothetical protein N8T08_002664 [Aspergillus melleus]|uniref:Uncharacterized protein n=1 Tax=Aspergillus melleus TaxID=138277 RepID=A0ACC3ALU6_9EURO|nr:hypothetical protein N8T08_002664 [Aspergillus melleus]